MKYNEVIHRFGLLLIIPFFLLMFPCAYIQVILGFQWIDDIQNMGLLLMSCVAGGAGLLFGAMSLHFLSIEWMIECGVVVPDGSNDPVKD